jgi:UDP-3-O-[3-hydroxymyristoyl] glucosamine N-acyltransferase
LVQSVSTLPSRSSNSLTIVRRCSGLAAGLASDRALRATNGYGGMSRPVFLKRARGLSFDEIVELTGALPRRKPRPDFLIVDVAAPERAGPADATFQETSESYGALRTSQAGACFIRDELADAVPQQILPFVVGDPYRAFVLVATALYPQALGPSSLFGAEGIASSALVHPTARLEPGVTVEPAAVIGPRTEIGAGSVIGPMAVIGSDVRIGRDCSIGAGASLTNTLLGDRVVVHAGCRIGQNGPGQGEAGRFERSPQLGRVVLQDQVEVGANCTIDRGGCGDTVIGEGTKIDNLVRVGSGVMVGRYCKIVATQGSQPAPHAVLFPELAGDQAAVPDGILIPAGAVGRTMASI